MVITRGKSECTQIYSSVTGMQDTILVSSVATYEYRELFIYSFRTWTVVNYLDPSI